MKGRQWTVSYEDGLQKVYYAENLIANLYAMADWFSPADTEAPTLETVQFFDRTTYKSVPLDEVPPVLFSEVMRDVDLVVSVAHVGGVDPEASLTTIEMRRVIVQESLRLLKISNVRLDGNYARVDGTLGEYAVHLGSGVSISKRREHCILFRCIRSIVDVSSCRFWTKTQEQRRFYPKLCCWPRIRRSRTRKFLHSFKRRIEF